MLVNSQPANTCSLRDRGLLYGDGVFETILCESGRPILLAGHTQRLENGCKRLGLPPQELSVILSDIRQVAGDQNCVIKVIITRGERDRGYAYDRHDNTASRIVYREDKPEIPQENYHEGIHLTQCHHPLPVNPGLAGIKHLNRLDQVLARSEWEHEFQEGIMLDTNGHVVEGTMTNIFIETDQQWVTPSVDKTGIAGVMRQWIMRNAYHADIECVETQVNIMDIQQADAIFVCNSVIGIWPVKQFKENTYNISAATSKLMQHIHENISTLYPV